MGRKSSKVMGIERMALYDIFVKNTCAQARQKKNYRKTLRARAKILDSFIYEWRFIITIVICMECNRKLK